MTVLADSCSRSMSCHRRASNFDGAQPGRRGAGSGSIEALRLRDAFGTDLVPRNTHDLRLSHFDLRRESWLFLRSKCYLQRDDARRYLDATSEKPALHVYRRAAL